MCWDHPWDFFKHLLKVSAVLSFLSRGRWRAAEKEATSGCFQHGRGLGGGRTSRRVVPSEMLQPLPGASLPAAFSCGSLRWRPPLPAPGRDLCSASPSSSGLAGPANFQLPGGGPRLLHQDLNSRARPSLGLSLYLLMTYHSLHSFYQSRPVSPTVWLFSFRWTQTSNHQGPAQLPCSANATKLFSGLSH